MSAGRIMVPPRELREGDRFRDEDGRLVWTAVEDADVLADSVSCRVEFPDGGITDRIWDMDARAIGIERA